MVLGAMALARKKRVNWPTQPESTLAPASRRLHPETSHLPLPRQQPERVVDPRLQARTNAAGASAGFRASKVVIDDTRILLRNALLPGQYRER